MIGEKLKSHERGRKVMRQSREKGVSHEELQMHLFLAR